MTVRKPLVRKPIGPGGDDETLPWDRGRDEGPSEPDSGNRALIPSLEWSRVCHHLPDMRRIRIDINGCLAGSPSCVPEAIEEYAVGWAFANRFFACSSELGRVTSSPAGVSMMLESGCDLDRRRYEAIGWIDEADRELRSEWDGDARSARAPRAVSFIDDLTLLSAAERVFGRFDADGTRFGFVHAAMVTREDIVCVARDLTTEAAATKILGWALRTGEDLAMSILVVRGVVDAPLVRAVDRSGITIIVTDAVPTRLAVEESIASCTTILGLALSHRRALFADGGQIGVSA